MKKTKLRLKLWVRVLLVIIFTGVILALLYTSIKDFNKLAEQCDQDKGYTCTIYEIGKYRR